MIRKIAIVALKLLMIGAVIGLHSCTKERFKMFDDLDCVTQEKMVRIELPLTDINPSGGKIKLEPKVYLEVISYKMGEEIGREYKPLDFTAKLINAPEKISLEVADRMLLITAPANTTQETKMIEISITSEGVTKLFTLTQKPKTYDVGGSIL